MRSQIMQQAVGSKRVLITGAAGNLGQKLCRSLAARGGYELVMLDLAAAPGSGIVNADLSRMDDAWDRHFAGVDCVVHLAADASPYASWQSLLSNNIVATNNVFDAAIAHGVGRIVFASSLHTMFGYQDKAARISADMPTQPLNLYGVSKVVGEELARGHATRHATSIICLRFGMVYRGERRPAAGVDTVARQQLWLSNADFCQACERAIAVEGIGFAVLQVTSKNEGSPWDLAATETALGYRPQDALTPVAPPVWRRAMGRLRQLRRFRSRGIV